MPKPNFFLIGAPKCGTTAVAKALGQHPEIFISDPKEPYYFLHTHGNPYDLNPQVHISDFQNYLSLFERAEGKKVIGEATSTYIHAPYVAEEIYKFNPNAKIMAILRNPLERAYSMYLFWYQHEFDVEISPRDFQEKFLSPALTTRSTTGRARDVMEFLKSFGFYYQLLTPYYAVFPRDQILVAAYEDLKADSAKFMKQVLQFLDVDASRAPCVTPENVTIEPRFRKLHYWLNVESPNVTRRNIKKQVGSSKTIKAIRAFLNRINQRKVPVAEFFPEPVYRELIDVYRDDIVNLSRLVGQDFTSWLRAPS